MDQVGQTRPGRLADQPPAGSAGGAVPAAATASPSATLQQIIREQPVVVFSKQICPSCRKTKEVLSNHLGAGQFEVVELDARPDGPALQQELERMTGKHTVPQVFARGRFLGGADEVSELESSGALDARLKGA